MKFPSVLLFFVSACVCSAAKIEIWETSKKLVSVSIQDITDLVDTEKEFTKIAVQSKSKKILEFDLKNKTLAEVFEAAVLNPNSGGQGFFGPVEEFILFDAEAQTVFLVRFESSRSRFAIAPMSEMGGGWYVTSRFSYPSRDSRIVTALKELR
jgi:hypothetical protein